VIRIEQGKGQKNRYVMLSPKLLDSPFPPSPGMAQDVGSRTFSAMSVSEGQISDSITARPCASIPSGVRLQSSPKPP
jgi:hypothetical protein